MWTFNSVGACVLTVALGGVFVLVLLLRQQRTQQDAPMWFMAGLVGLLVGAGGATAAIQLMGGYKAQLDNRRYAPTAEDMAMVASANPTPGSGGSAAIGGGPGAGGRGPGGGAGGPGGFRPSPQRQLATLVQKLELLTGDIQLELSAEQKAAVATALEGLEASERISEEDAQAKYEALLAVLSEEQKAKEQAVALPRRRGGGPPGGGGEQDGDANPFAEQELQEKLDALRSRLR